MVECTTATYTIDPWNIFYPVTVNNRCMMMDTGKVFDGISDDGWNIVSRARFDPFFGTGHGYVQFIFYPEGNYMVLDTDYDNYAIVYGCDDWFFGLMHLENAWLLNRERNSANIETYK